jgi:phosphoribosylformylglycinamidine synthase subunit PurS
MGALARRWSFGCRTPLPSADGGIRVIIREWYELSEGTVPDSNSPVVVVEVRVELKAGILDPEAASIEKSLGLLGVPEVSRVATARVYTLEFAGVDAAEAERLAARAVDRLLANPVIHRVSIGTASPP